MLRCCCRGSKVHVAAPSPFRRDAKHSCRGHRHYKRWLLLELPPGMNLYWTVNHPLQTMTRCCHIPPDVAFRRYNFQEVFCAGQGQWKTHRNHGVWIWTMVGSVVNNASVQQMVTLSVHFKPHEYLNMGNVSTCVIHVWPGSQNISDPC